MIRLGVDFGTSNTVAVLAVGERAAAQLLFDGSPLLPSAVCADPGDGLLAGRDAVQAAQAAPERFEPHPKRRIDDGVVLLGAAEVPVEALVAAVLGRVAQEARRVAGREPEEVVLTFPAGWGAPRRALLVEAARRAGLGPVRLVAEPVAAAAAFLRAGGAAVPVGAALLVYDFGAGTFDATVVRRTADGFDTLAAHGLADAGGLDIDAAIVAEIAVACPDPVLWARLSGPATPGDQRAARQLWDNARAAKETLSRRATAIVHVPLLDRDVPLGRDRVDALAAPVVRRTVEAVNAVLADAGLDPGDLSGVFLVGGASRLPLAATALLRELRIPPTVLEQPELAVAEGSLHAPPIPDPPPPPAEPPTPLAAPPSPPAEIPSRAPDLLSPADGTRFPPAAVPATVSDAAPRSAGGSAPAWSRRRLVVAVAVTLVVAIVLAIVRNWPRDTPQQGSQHSPGATPSSAAASLSASPTAIKAPVPGAQETADAFAAAWVHHTGVTAAKWHDSLRPYATTPLMNELMDADPADVPADRVTGASTATDTGATGYEVQVPVNTGTLILTMVWDGTHWLASSFDYSVP